MRQPYTGPVFDTADEYQGFKVFLKLTSSALSGAFECPTWAYLLPQQASIEPFIRYGIAALGSLTACFMEVMALRMKGLGSVEEGNCLGTTDSYSRTLELYAKSLRYMRIALAKPGHTFRDTMLGCLLVVCFESFHGYNHASMMHAQNGLEIFFAWLGKQYPISSATSPFHSPNRADLEDDLFHALLRLDVQVLSFFDTRPSYLHGAISSHGDEALRSMPSVFLSISQARVYWDLVSRRTSHFLASAFSAAGASSKAFMFDDPVETYPEFLGLPSGIKLFAQSPVIPTGQKAERERFASEIEAWERAFAPLFKQLLGCSHQQAHGATVLIMHAKMTSILLSGAFFKSEMDYDTLTPTFQSIVALATSIWSSHTISVSIGVSFNFDLGILPPLFLVGTRCRDRVVRREAISLLLSDFHRESSWDSFGTALIARWVLGMEEDGVSSHQKTAEVDFIYGAESESESSSTDIVLEAKSTPTDNNRQDTTFTSNTTATTQSAMPSASDVYAQDLDVFPSQSSAYELMKSIIDGERAISDNVDPKSPLLGPVQLESDTRPPSEYRIAIERRMRGHLDRTLPHRPSPPVLLGSSGGSHPQHHKEFLSKPTEEIETATVETTTEAKQHCATVEWETQPIPESRRLRIAKFHVDLNKRRAQLEYTQGPVGNGNRVEVMRHNVLW